MVNVQVHTEARFNVLLTEDRERSMEHWTRQLPRLLQPQGVRAFVARTGEEAFELAGREAIHAAFIDVSTPRTAEVGSMGPVGAVDWDNDSDAWQVGPTAGAGDLGEPGGMWLLELFRRMPNRPPIVVVNHRPYSPQQIQRFLNRALRLGAFSVINRPSDLETLLHVIQRVIDRQYAGAWPKPKEEEKS